MEIKEGKAGLYVQCLSCGITEVMNKDSKHINKHEQQKLVKQYAKQEPVGNSLGDLLKAAMEKKNQ
jgi:DNA topoisomerase-3